MKLINEVFSWTQCEKWGYVLEQRFFNGKLSDCDLLVT
jgi:hypothetical protein